MFLACVRCQTFSRLFCCMESPGHLIPQKRGKSRGRAYLLLNKCNKMFSISNKQGLVFPLGYHTPTRLQEQPKHSITQRCAVAKYPHHWHWHLFQAKRASATESCADADCSTAPCKHAISLATCAQPLKHSVEVKCLHDSSAYKALKSSGGLALLPGFPLTGW